MAMVVLQIQQFNRFAICASIGSDKASLERELRRQCAFQTQVAPSVTQQITEKILVGEEAGGASGDYSCKALERLDNTWSNIGQFKDQTFLKTGNNLVGSFDIAVCGVAFGKFLPTDICEKGLRVDVVETNEIKGAYLLTYDVLGGAIGLW